MAKPKKRQDGRSAGNPPPEATPPAEMPTDGPPRELPVWDEKTGRLRWRGLVKEFLQDGENQVSVVKEFCAQGWPEWIKITLPNDGAVDERNQLRNTVQNLNRAFKSWPLEFHANTKRMIILCVLEA